MQVGAASHGRLCPAERLGDLSVGAQPPPSLAVDDALPVSTSESTDSVTVPSPGVPSLMPGYPGLQLLSRALTYDACLAGRGERMAPD